MNSEAFDLTPYEGLYREPVTGTFVWLALGEQGVLRSEQTSLLPLSSTEFQVGSSSRKYVFERDGSQISGFRLDDGQSFARRYERVEAWSPTERDLDDFIGTYRSDDAETTIVVRRESETLSLWQRPNDSRSVTPVYSDAFTGRGTIVRFRRDAQGRVIGLSLSVGRVYDMRFARADS